MYLNTQRENLSSGEKGGTQTHIGTSTLSQLETDLMENTDCSICCTCHRAPLHLEKLKTDYRPVTTAFTLLKMAQAIATASALLSIIICDRNATSSEENGCLFFSQDSNEGLAHYSGVDCATK